MEGRVDFSALDRSRLLGSLPSGSLGHLFPSGEPSTSSALSRLSAASAAAVAASAGVSPSELTRAGSPNALQQYVGRFLPSSGLHSSGASYAMMAGYLANTGHMPESLKHLMPEFQQYWASAAHSEGYARYILNNIYYPYLPYLPATDTLSFFAQNSANAQVQAALQAQSAHHRIYDLQKEAIFNSGGVPRGFYPPHIFPPGGQLEATNLSLPSSSKSKQSERDKSKETETKDVEDRKDRSSNEKNLHSPERKCFVDSEKERQSYSDKDKSKCTFDEKPSKGSLSKTDDREKIKSSCKSLRTDKYYQNPNQCNINSSKSIASSTNSKEPGEVVTNLGNVDTDTKVIKDIIDTACRERDRKRADPNSCSPRNRTLISPTRHERVVSPDRRSVKAYSPLAKKALHVQVHEDDAPLSTFQFQDVPENLCVKDRKWTKSGDVKSDAKGCIRTQCVVTGTTITVTSTQNVITSEYSRIDSSLECHTGKGSISPGSQISPTHSRKSTVTTYSLPYYHNLYSRTTQDGKKVHAVTYVPEIGTISSPIFGAPAVINVVDTHKAQESKDTVGAQALNLSRSDDRRKSELTREGTRDEDKTDGKKFDKRKDEKEVDVISIDVDKACDLSKSETVSGKRHIENAEKFKDTKCVHSLTETVTSRHKSDNNSKGLCSLPKQGFSVASDDDIIDVDKLDECDKEAGEDNKRTGDKKPTEPVGADKSVIRKNHSSDNDTEKHKKCTGLTNRHKSTYQCDTRKESEEKHSCDLNHNSENRSKTVETAKNSPVASSSSTISSSPMNSAIDLSKDTSKDKRPGSENSDSIETRSKASRTTSFHSRDEAKGPTKKQITPVKPLVTRNLQSLDAERDDNDSKQGAHSVSSPSRNGDSPLKTGVPKYPDSQQQASSQSIPVGIAVARQRSIAPKVAGLSDKDGRKTSEDTKTKSQTSDIKPTRPLKIIRPSTKGSTPTVTEKRNELPANLIVTGGSTPQGVFWPDDPASRQLAAQVLQNSHQITPTTWYNPTQFPLPQSVVTPTSDGTQNNQLPLTVPPGYKLAQDSLTGQILLIPSGADVYDTSRVFGYPIGTQIHQSSTFAPPVLNGQQNASSIPTNTNLFPGQQAISERPATVDFSVSQFPQIYNASVLPSSEVSIKVDKGDHQPQQTTSSVVAPPIIIPNTQESAAVPVNLNQEGENDKDKAQSAIVTDIPLASGQTFTFSTPNVPFVFNSNSLLPSQNASELNSDVSLLKQEQTTVQSRGTSPMLPATDSSAEDNEECATLAEVKSVIESEKVIESAKTVATTKSDVESSPVIVNDTKNESAGITSEVDSAEVKSDLVADNCDNVESTDKSVEKKSRDEEDLKRKHKSQTDSNDSESNSIVVTEISAKGKADCTVSAKKIRDRKKEPTVSRGSKVKSDRNIFTDLTEYNPFTDPHVLQAADGLELLSALAVAEKSSLKPNASDETAGDCKKSPSETSKTELKDDVYTFTDEHATSVGKSEEKNGISISGQEKSPVITEKNVGPVVISEKIKSRVRCGHAFKPRKKESATPTSPSPKRMMTFCGITIPEDLDSFLKIDDDVIDSIEMEMKMRLAELQRRYREKQRELARLTPKRDKESDKDAEKSNISSDKLLESKRGPGRPKKRKHDNNESKDLQSGKCGKKDGTHGASQNGHKSHGLNKKKRMAELLVDRVFRKTGSSFKIPLSKKVNLIAPARIEFPSATSPSCSASSSSERTDRVDPVHHNKPIDFGRLIKRSRFSQFGGRERGFVGGIWHKKDERKKQKHSLFHSSNVKKKKKEKSVPVESGLGLLAKYATETRENHIQTNEETNAKRKATDGQNNNAPSPESPNKKRKPGRPKKCDVIRPGITETLVAKQSKHIDFFRWQTEARKEEPKQERKISLEGKTPLKPLYLDEWNVRRSERIFLNDPSPQTSPNAVSPDSKGKKEEKTKDVKTESSRKHEQPKKSRSVNLSQKVKKKYSVVITQQKSKYKTEQLKASRDQLSQTRKEQKRKRLSSGSGNIGGSDSETDDIPLSSFRPSFKEQGTPSCVIEKDELKDEMRILVFMDGLFHEGELKAIRPPDIYGAILDNERKTRPHYFSQEEILKDAIKDVKPTDPSQLKEGTRICAYWSQQFSCLYPGTISRGSPSPDDSKDLVNVEFDDGDTGRIPLDHIRIIPQDFPLVEYDPNPLLFLTKRRRTVSVSETSEPRKSVSNDVITPIQSQQKDKEKEKPKRGPGRPPKVDRLMSNESVGEEDVFIEEKKKSTESKANKNDDEDDDDENVEIIAPTSRGLWSWSGSPTKRPGLKGKAKKEYYKTIVRGRESISVGESAVFLSIGRPNLPYVGRIESLWESWGGHMTVKVKWFYHPEETKGGKRLQNMKGALFRSDHEDDNDVQTISHKCEVIPYAEYRRRKDVISLADNDDVYYLAGSYQPTIGHITFEPGVMNN